MEIVAQNTIFPSLKEATQVIGTFILITFSWIFFRAENISHAFDFISTIFSTSFFSSIEFSDRAHFNASIILIIIMLIIEWTQRKHNHTLENFGLNVHSFIRNTFYLALIITLFWFGGEEQQFIYFQF